MRINVFACVFHLCRQCKLLYSAQYYSTPTQTVATAWRRQIINTQGGVVHFRLYSTLWSEGGLGWGGVLSDRDGWLWPWHQFPASLFPAAPSPLLPGYQTTIAALWPSCQVESLQTTTSLGLSRQWAQGPAGAQQHSRLVRHAGHIVRRESESSQYDPVPPLSIVDQCSWNSRAQQFMMFQFGFVIVLDCCAIVLGWKEMIYWSIHVFYCKIGVKHSFHYCTINAGFRSFPAFIWRDVWQRARFFLEPERMQLNPRSNPGCLHFQCPRAQVYPGLRDHTPCWPPAWSLWPQSGELLPCPSLSLASPHFHADAGDGLGQTLPSESS